MPVVSKRVLVEHTSGVRKYVLRTKLRELGKHWKQVPDQARTRRKQEEVSPPESSDAAANDPDKEN